MASRGGSVSKQLRWFLAACVFRAAALERVGKLKLLDRKALEDTKRMAAAQLDTLNAQHLKLMKRVKVRSGDVCCSHVPQRTTVALCGR